MSVEVEAILEGVYQNYLRIGGPAIVFDCLVSSAVLKKRLQALSMS